MNHTVDTISRRKFLVGTTCAATAGLLVGDGTIGVAAASDETGDEWTQPGATSAHTSAVITGSGPTGELSHAWRGDLGGYYGDIRIGGVVDGTVYASGSLLGAFDATDGAKQWTFEPSVPEDDYPETPTPDVEAPSIMNNTVFAPLRIGVFDGDNTFHSSIVAVDAESGEKQWRIGTPSDTEFSSLTASDEGLFVCGPDLEDGNGQFLYGLNPDDGSENWRQPLNRDTNEFNSPVVVDGRVFVADSAGVTAYEAATGKHLWDAVPRVKDLSVTMADDGTLFVYEVANPGSTIIALETTTGDEQWRTAYGGETDVTVQTVDENQLYIATSEDDGDAVALDRSDGSENWRVTIPQPPKDPENPPRVPVPEEGMARVGSLLYVGGAVIEPTDGSIISTQGIEGPFIGGYQLEAVAGGQIYIGGDDMIVMKGSKTQTGSICR